MPVFAVANQKGGVGKCLDADTQIVDPRTGLSRTLREVVKSDQNTVHTLVERHHVATLPIRSKVDSGIQPCVRLRFASGRSVITTRHHPFLLPDGWRAASAVAVGETAALPLRLPHPTEPVRLLDAEVDLLAVLLAEGGCSQRGIRFSTTDPTVLEIARSAAETLGMTVRHVGGCDYALSGHLTGDARLAGADGLCRCGCGEPISVATKPQRRRNIRPGDRLPNKRGHGQRIGAPRAYVRRFGLDRLAKHKHLPSAVLRLPADQLARFLAVFFMCDGTVGARGPCLTLASETLVRSVQHLLLRFGVQSSVQYRASRFGERLFDAWNLRVYSSSYRAFLDNVPLWGTKRERLARLCEAHRNPSVGIPVLTEPLRLTLRRAAPAVRQSRGVPSLASVRDRLGWSHFQFDFLASEGGGLARKPLQAFCEVFDLKHDHGWLYDASSEIFWDRIVSIEDAGLRQVYDLEVPHTHCFVANDIVVHNTTTVVNVGAYLGALGSRVLLVDCDAQSNTTGFLGVDPTGPSLYDVLIEGTLAEEAIVETTTQGVHLLPATPDLAGADVELLRADSPESSLKRALDPLRDRFSYVFLDCPPSLGIMTVNALVAADAVLIPVQCEYLALEGLARLMSTLDRIRHGANPSLQIFGLVMTMYDARTVLSAQVAEEVRRHYPALTFKTVIPRNVRLSEAPSFGRSILDYDPYSRGAEAYQALALEVASRVPDLQRSA